MSAEVQEFLSIAVAGLAAAYVALRLSGRTLPRPRMRGRGPEETPNATASRRLRRALRNAEKRRAS
ncbi:MAG: hypothetical protein ACFB9M_01745 [Myxococcota bacterium]